MKNCFKVLSLAFLFVLTVSSCALPKFPIGSEPNDSSSNSTNISSSSSEVDPSSSFEEESSSSLDSSVSSSSHDETSSLEDGGIKMEAFINKLNDVPLNNVIEEFKLTKFYKPKKMEEPDRVGPVVNDGIDIISYVYDDRDVFGLSSEFLSFSDAIKNEYSDFKELLINNLFHINDHDFRSDYINGEEFFAFKKSIDANGNFYAKTNNGFSLIASSRRQNIYSIITNRRFYFYKEYQDVKFKNNFSRFEYPTSCFNSLIYLERDDFGLNNIVYYHFLTDCFYKEQVNKCSDGSIKYINTYKMAFDYYEANDVLTFKDDYLIALNFDRRYFSRFYSDNLLKVLNDDPDRGLWTAQIQYLGDGYVSLHPRDNLLAVDAKLLNDVKAMIFHKNIGTVKPLYDYFGIPAKTLITSAKEYPIIDTNLKDKFYPMCSYIVSSHEIAYPSLAKRLELGGKIISDGYLNTPLPSLINVFLNDYNNRLLIDSNFESLLTTMSINRFKNEDFLLSISDENSLKLWASSTIQTLLDPAGAFVKFKSIVDDAMNSN